MIITSAHKEYLEKLKNIVGNAMAEAIREMPSGISTSDGMTMLARTLYASCATVLLRALDPAGEIPGTRVAAMLTGLTNAQFPVMGQSVAKLYCAETLSKEELDIANDMIEGKIGKDEAIRRATERQKGSKPSSDWFRNLFKRG